MATYPIVLDLAGRSCVVIGGGPVAQRKVEGLLQAGAAVTVVSPRLCPALAALASRGDIQHVCRRYQRGDLAGAALAFVATGDRRLSAAVARDGRRRRVWVNVADDPEHCDFFLPSVLRRGPLLVAVATGGASPALARAVREELERLLPEDYATLAETVAQVRRDLRARGVRPDAETWSRALSTEIRRLRATSSGPDDARLRLLQRLEISDGDSRGATASPGRPERRGAGRARGSRGATASPGRPERRGVWGARG